MSIERETFNGTGYDLSWSTTGSPDPDYTTSPAPLEGAQSCLLVGTATTGIYKNMLSTYPEVYVAFMFRMTGTTWQGYPSPIGIYNGGTMLARIDGDSGANTVSMFAGSLKDGSIFTLGGGTTYYVKVRYKAGTGANSEVEIWKSSNGLSGNWGTSYKKSNGDATLNAQRIEFYNLSQATNLIILDDIRYDTGDINYDAGGSATGVATKVNHYKQCGAM